MSKISLVVTHYKEPWDIVKPLFDSIQDQYGIDLENELEVVFVNDSDKLGFEFPDYSFPVVVIDEGHHGVSAARNIGLDKSTGDYVMFCDCDDRFISPFAMHLYKQQIGKYDIIKTPFIEDQMIDGQLRLFRHEKDVSFVHGKLYRRQFLIDNKIRFNEKLTIHEDGYFNVIAGILAGGSQYEMSLAVYLWKYNAESVVRKDKELFIYKTYNNLMDCRIAICRELRERELLEHYFPSVIKTVMDSYYDFQKPDALKPENKELIESAEKAFARFYKEFREDYTESNINDIAQMMYVCRANAFKNNMRVEQETINEFLTRIVKKYLT